MYRVGDVVCIDYNDFTGNKKIGLFLIIYSERQDRSYSAGHSNITCVKLTTNNFRGDSYVVKLHRGDANLQEDCLVNLSKIHTFISKNNYKIIGRLGPNEMSRVFKELTKFNQEVLNQVMETF